jgi:hypothetical protein
MRISNKRTSNLALAASLVALSALGTGCELIVDFNRALIEGGVDGAFVYVDAGDAGDASLVDAVTDAAIVVPDAVSDVRYVDATPDAHRAVEAATDARHDVGVDAKVVDSTVGPDGTHADSASPTDAKGSTKTDAKG